MGPRTWSEDWDQRQLGQDCPMCAAVRPDDPEGDILATTPDRYRQHFVRQAS